MYERFQILWPLYLRFSGCFVCRFALFVSYSACRQYFQRQFWPAPSGSKAYRNHGDFQLPGVYIRVAASQGWMSGYLGGNFKPEEPVLYKDAVKAVLTLLGYTDEDFTGEMVSSWISKFNHLELNENVSCQADEPITETDCMNIFYNLLKTKKTERSIPFPFWRMSAKAPSWFIRTSAWPSPCPLIRRMPMYF